ncbi:MAG: hypothetical protein ABJV04_05940 [Aliiglaciecola sp.]|uniref:hypothetical protein n=1 Tax=Aliiglaciecola sp. TaxID=1872441 RepID=UPI003299B0C3
MNKSNLNNNLPIQSCLKTQQGFVLTIELILLVTILVIGSFVGIVAVRDALYKQKIKQLDNTIVVADSNGTVMGEVVNLDEHDAPQLFYIDRTATEPAQNYRALIGVRDDRFTSREPIYYTQLNCQGDPCIKPVSSESLDNSGVSRLPNTGAVSYFQALQGGPNYAIGRSPNGIPGFLYKQTLEVCPMPELIGGIGSPIGSRYVSQKVVTGEPCESPVNLPLDAGQPPLTCSSNDPIGALGAPIAARCDAACGSNNGSCACPSGYYQVSGGLVDSLGLDGQCCPIGSEFTETSALGLGVGGNALCAGLNLKKAVSVANINDPNQNALEPFTPPFQINLPAAGGRTEGDQWYSTQPQGEGSN